MTEILHVDDGFTIRTGSDADPLVVLLHGFGSNEQDLPGLAAHLPGGLAYASLRAPLTIGPGSYAWVPIKVPGRPDPDVTQASTDAVLAWLDAYVAEDRPVVLLGFSQGGLMVSQLIRARPERFLAGLVLSGFVLDTVAPGDAALAVRQMPVFFGHGDADPVIARDATERASTWLATHANTTEKAYAGLAHGISAEELADVVEFLQAHVS